MSTGKRRSALPHGGDDLAPEALGAIVDALRTTLGVEVCGLWRPDEEAGVLRLAAISSRRVKVVKAFVDAERGLHRAIRS